MSAKNLTLGILVAGAMTAAVVAAVYLAAPSSVQLNSCSPGGGSCTSSTSNNSTSSASPSLAVTSNSTSSTNSTAWAVLNSNTTVYGNLACEDTVAVLYPVSCPPTYPGVKSPSLTNVEIISYRGQVLYDANISIGINGQPITWTMWFTNSTIFCVSPSDGYALCPTHPTYPTIIITTPSASSSNSSNGLRLDLQLSNTTEGVNVTVDVYNTLNTFNNVTSASDWAIYSNSLNDISDNQVVAFAVYQGNYGAGNFTAGSPLAIDNVGGGNIGPVLSPSVVYSFNPDSGVASAPAGAFAPGPFSKNVTLSYTVSGYSTCSVGTLSFRPQNASGLWLCPQDTGYKFNPFPPATYTVVGLDQWGDVAVLHFEVYG
jgi:hypothetical protein